MTFKELFRLSHREYTSYRTRSRATVITIGVLFGALLAILFVVQGLENVVLRYAGDATNGEVYLVSSYEGNRDDLMMERLREFGGEVVDLTDEQKAEIGEEIPESVVIAKFTNLKNAYEYYSKADARELHYSADDYQIAELFSNQVSVYRYFRDKNKDFIRPASVVLMAVSAFILAFTMAHLIASSTKTFVLYRSIGASRGQILSIYFMYLLELCVKAAVFAVILALVLAGVGTAVAWNYLLEQLTALYPQAPRFLPILVGINWQCLEAMLCMFIAAPISFLLCLDQFSNKKIAQKLKGD